MISDLEGIASHGMKTDDMLGEILKAVESRSTFWAARLTKARA